MVRVVNTGNCEANYTSYDETDSIKDASIGYNVDDSQDNSR